MDCYNVVKGSYSIFGLEAGGECHGSNDLTKATSSPATSPCDWKCSGDGGACGAGWTLSIYTINPTSQGACNWAESRQQHGCSRKDGLHNSISFILTHVLHAGSLERPL